MATISQQEFLKGGKKIQVVVPASANLGVPKEEQPGFLQRVGEDLKKRGSNITQTFKDTASGKINPLETGVQTAGAVAGGVNDILGEGVKSAVEALPESVKEPVRQGAVYVLQTRAGQAGLNAISQGMEKYAGWKSENPQLAKDLESVVNIAALLPIGKGGQIAKEGTEQAAIKGGELATKGAAVTKRATEKILKKVGTPDPTPLQAAGQILQGETSDVAKGVKGLANLDTKDVKTFKDLNAKINTKISALAQEVDADLASDPTKQLLEKLTVSAKTTGGKVVTTRPVENALSQLDELYTKIGDDVEAANIKELIQIAKTEGLSKQEVNDIARVYGKELGEKAFGKTGDPFTSVNAQMYENTRKALKNIARSGLKGDAAKSADQAMSNLYSTQRLIKQNVEAVNKLKQKITERGLFEKWAYKLTKFADIVSLGTVRGVVGGILPRGVGYKVMNALDIEQNLQKNLKVIQDAIKSGSNKELEEILKKL